MRKTYSPCEKDPAFGYRFRQEWDEIRTLLLRRVRNLVNIQIVAEVKNNGKINHNDGGFAA